MAKYNKERHEEELAYTEQQILTVRRPYLIERNIMAHYRVSRRTAARWRSEVHARWRAESTKHASPEGMRESRRDRNRATIELVIALALARTEVVKDADGNPLLDEAEFLPQRDSYGNEQRNPNYKKPITRAKPDLQRVINALTSLRHLDGLAEPFKLEANITGLQDMIPDFDTIPAEARELFVKGLEHMAPDGDLRNLAGELLKAGARAEKLN